MQQEFGILLWQKIYELYFMLAASTRKSSKLFFFAGPICYILISTNNAYFTLYAISAGPCRI